MDLIEDLIEKEQAHANCRIVFDFGLSVCVCVFLLKLKIMPQEDCVAVSLRRNLSRRRSFRSVGGVDRDDRGWTSLHIGARKGDLKQVIIVSSFLFLALFIFSHFFFLLWSLLSLLLVATLVFILYIDEELYSLYIVYVNGCPMIYLSLFTSCCLPGQYDGNFFISCKIVFFLSFKVVTLSLVTDFILVDWRSKIRGSMRIKCLDS